MDFVVGDLELSYEALELPADNELAINVYIAEAGSRSEEALRLLGSWAAGARSCRHGPLHERRLTSKPPGGWSATTSVGRR